jgi:hypothetical protein
MKPRSTEMKTKGGTALEGRHFALTVLAAVVALLALFFLVCGGGCGGGGVQPAPAPAPSALDERAAYLGGIWDSLSDCAQAAGYPAVPAPRIIWRTPEPYNGPVDITCCLPRSPNPGPDGTCGAGGTAADKVSIYIVTECYYGDGEDSTRDEAYWWHEGVHHILTYNGDNRPHSEQHGDPLFSLCGQPYSWDWRWEEVK